MINYSISWTSKSPAPKTEPTDPLRQGIAAHRGGRLDAAIEQYALALRARPNRAAASFNLGVALIETGLGLSSLPYLLRAGMLQPQSETFNSALMYALVRSARLDDAQRHLDERSRVGFSPDVLARWRQCLAVHRERPNPVDFGLAEPALLDPVEESPDPDSGLRVESPDHSSLQGPFAAALADYEAGHFARMLAGLEPVLEAHPNWGEGLHLFGLALLGVGRAPEAVDALSRASECLPGRAEILDHLGIAQAGLDRSEAVLWTYEKALAINPLRPESWNNLADAAMQRGRPDLAFQYALHAVRLKPDLRESITTLFNSAVVMDHSGGAGRDDGSPRLALAVDFVADRLPDPEIALHAAAVLEEVGAHPESGRLLGRSWELFGDRPPGLLGRLLLNRRRVCDWREWDVMLPLLLDRVRGATDDQVMTPFSALSVPGLSRGDLRQIARLRSTALATWARSRMLAPAAAGGSAGRLKIGYLSADFQEHATAYLTAAVFEQHDRHRFEFFAYSSGPDDGGSMRRRLIAAFEHFVDIGAMSADDAAQRIRDDGIDILIDLKGYTKSARTEILALRPCPIQVNWLGFPGGMGASFIDYMIADPVVVPPEHAPDYDEAVAYLPHAYAPVDTARHVAKTPSRAAAGLPDEGFVFCCFNDPYKISPLVFDRWCGLLRDVPGSVLWLFGKSPDLAANLRREATRRGVADERLVFAPRRPQPEHLARLALADLVLDTLPYNAHTTASDALWMGVPMVTCIGDTFPARVAASLLTAAGVPDLITTDLDACAALARRFALNVDELAAFRARLAKAKTTAPYFDSARFTRSLEALYEQMWARHQRGLGPARLDAVGGDALH